MSRKNNFSRGTLITTSLSILAVALLATGCGGGKKASIESFEADRTHLEGPGSVTFTITGEVKEGTMSTLDEDFSVTIDLLVDGESVASILNEDPSRYVSEYTQTIRQNFDAAGVYEVTATATPTHGENVVEWENPITITVEEAEVVDVTGITLADSSVSIDVGETHVFEYTIAPSDATNTRVSWSTSDPDVAYFAHTPSNQLIGKSDGNVTITVTTADGGHTDTSTVTVGDASPPDGSSFARALPMTVHSSDSNSNSVTIPWGGIYYRFELATAPSLLHISQKGFSAAATPIKYEIYRSNESVLFSEDSIPAHSQWHELPGINAGEYYLKLTHSGNMQSQSGEILLWTN